MNFSDIPTRGVSTVNPSWWNSLKTAGQELSNRVGAGTSALADYASVGYSDPHDTGLNIDTSIYGAFFAIYRVYRKTTGAGATELAEAGTLTGVFSPVAGTWELTQTKVGDALTTFTITGAGHVQFLSTPISGDTIVNNLISLSARLL